MAHNGHRLRHPGCPLLGAKQTLGKLVPTPASDPAEGCRDALGISGSLVYRQQFPDTVTRARLVTKPDAARGRCEKAHS